MGHLSPDLKDYMNFKEFLTKESVIIAALPLFGYVVAIAYEYGYAVYFGYPLSLIVVDLRMTLTSMIFGVLYIYVLLKVFDFISVMSLAEGDFAKFLRVMLPNYLMAGVLVFASGFSGPFFKLGISLSAIYTVIYGVGVLIDAKKMGVSAAVDKLAKEEEPKPVVTKVRYRGQVLINLFNEYGFMVLIVLGLVFGAGRLAATSKNQFSSFEIDNETYAIVAIYADSVIGARLKDATLTEEFAVVSKGNDAMTKVGLLNLKKPKDKESVSPVPIPY
jgi:hypothetical protein